MVMVSHADGSGVPTRVAAQQRQRALGRVRTQCCKAGLRLARIAALALPGSSGSGRGACGRRPVQLADPHHDVLASPALKRHDLRFRAARCACLSHNH